MQRTNANRHAIDGRVSYLRSRIATLDRQIEALEARAPGTAVPTDPHYTDLANERDRLSTELASYDEG